jgi:hypothetical protein
MGREHIAILLLVAALACLACGAREVKKTDSDNREAAFQRKRVCAELGSQRLALDRRKDETESEEVTHAVGAEWCFSTEMNTCIYSSTDNIVIPLGPENVPTITMSAQSTIDLLTNRKLISVERVKASRAELEKYENKRRELLSKCQ